MEIAGVTLTETDGQIFLRHQPVAGREPVDKAALLALLEGAGCAECALLEDEIARAANDCNTVDKPFVLHVADRRNASIQVSVAADEMGAQVCLLPPQGGKDASMDDVVRALTEVGVVFGIDADALAQVCGSERGHAVTVAKGVLAENGHDTVFETLLPPSSDRAPKVNADGLIDYREHGGIVVVHPGEALMRRIPATPGVAGHTVRGRDLPPRPGLDVPFASQLAGTQVASNDPNVLQAAAIGQPVLVEHGAMVEPVLHLAEVNMASGNVHFDGTVQVDGDVLHGMLVQASGDIVVRGTVDGGVLEAGGDVHVASGIIAQARVQAKGAISARFAENCTLHAGTVIALDDMALECQLESLNQIIIGAKQPHRARLVGGHATATMLLRVPLLGSNKGGITHVVVGVDHALEAQMQELALRLEKEKGVEENLQKLVKQLGTAGDPKGMLERVNAAWRQAVQQWSKSLAERGVLEQQLARLRAATVAVGVGVDGAADLVVCNKPARLRSEFSDGVFSIDAENKVLFTDTAGKVQVVG